MRKTHHPNIKFLVGAVDGVFTTNGWINRHNMVFGKKTKALATANQILTAQGLVYIKVTYGRAFCNDGIYSSKKELEKALSGFTEDSLIRYALKGVKDGI